MWHTQAVTQTDVGSASHRTPPCLLRSGNSSSGVHVAVLIDFICLSTGHWAGICEPPGGERRVRHGCTVITTASGYLWPMGTTKITGFLFLFCNWLFSYLSKRYKKGWCQTQASCIELKDCARQQDYYLASHTLIPSSRSTACGEQAVRMPSPSPWREWADQGKHSAPSRF